MSRLYELIVDLFTASQHFFFQASASICVIQTLKKEREKLNSPGSWRELTLQLSRAKSSNGARQRGQG